MILIGWSHSLNTDHDRLIRSRRYETKQYIVILESGPKLQSFRMPLIINMFDYIMPTGFTNDNIKHIFRLLRVKKFSSNLYDLYHTIRPIVTDSVFISAMKIWQWRFTHKYFVSYFQHKISLLASFPNDGYSSHQMCVHSSSTRTLIFWWCRSFTIFLCLGLVQTQSNIGATATEWKEYHSSCEQCHPIIK